MTRRTFAISMAALAGIAAASAAVAAGTAVSAVPVLRAIDHGVWQLEESASAATPAVVRKLCLGDPALLVQIEHPGLPCRQYIIKHDARSVTVSYSCPTGGQGLTTIRRETSGLIQVQSQGIKDGAPFSLSLEGRRTGSCGRLTRR